MAKTIEATKTTTHSINDLTHRIVECTVKDENNKTNNITLKYTKPRYKEIKKIPLRVYLNNKYAGRITFATKKDVYAIPDYTLDNYNDDVKTTEFTKLRSNIDPILPYKDLRIAISVHLPTSWFCFLKDK